MEQTIIKQKAKEILDKYGFKRPVDIVQLAESMGFVVGNAKMSEEDDGFILINDDVQEIMGVKAQKLIGVNYELDLFTKRLIIARALGYYILYGEGKAMFARRVNVSDGEDVKLFE